MPSHALRIQENTCLLELNTLAVPARCDYFVGVCDEEGLLAACQWARQQQLPLMPLGGGSNLVFRDRVPALVAHIQTKGIDHQWEGDQVLVRAKAGENWHGLVAHCVERGWFGIENLALIPGSVGAAPIQNIGAYGVELSQVLERVRAIEIATGQAHWFSRDQCQLGYRQSFFKSEAGRDRFLITDVVLRLASKPQLQLDYPLLRDYLDAQQTEPSGRSIFDAVCAIRSARLPAPERTPNVGSFFHNPVITRDHYQTLLHAHPDLPAYAVDSTRVKLPAAALIERVGWKGRLRRGVGISEQHALVLVNPGRECGRAILQFAAQVQQAVADTFGVTLQIEPRIYPDRE